MTFKTFILGLIGIVAGLLIIKYREKLQTWTGNISFAEKYIGPGGTFTLLLLIGSATVILSILFMTGILQDFVKEAAGPYF
jgi:hypothetical protein